LWYDPTQILRSKQVFAQARLWAQTPGSKQSLPPRTRVSAADGRSNLMHQVWTVWDWGTASAPSPTGEEYIPIAAALGLHRGADPIQPRP